MSDLGFLWPGLLILVVLAILLIFLYQRFRFGKSRSHIEYPDLSLLALASRQTNRRRLLPIILYGSALIIALIAVARPTAKLLRPDNLSGIIFAIETGRSMQSWDIEPTRMAATQMAAKELVDTIPKSIKVGLATFSGSGVLNVPLTNDHERVKEGIDSLGTGGGFSFSYGLIASLQALPEDLPEDGVPGAIVLFSHGHDNSMHDPVALAEQAAERGIPIHTIGVGTHGNNFSEDILQIVADTSGGKYYPIFSAADLQEAHKDLGKIIRLRPRTTEVTALPALVAAFLLAISLMMAQIRRRLV